MPDVNRWTFLIAKWFLNRFGVIFSFFMSFPLILVCISHTVLLSKSRILCIRHKLWSKMICDAANEKWNKIELENVAFDDITYVLRSSTEFHPKFSVLFIYLYDRLELKLFVCRLMSRLNVCIWTNALSINWKLRYNGQRELNKCLRWGIDRFNTLTIKIKWNETILFSVDSLHVRIIISLFYVCVSIPRIPFSSLFIQILGCIHFICSLFY